MQLKLRNKNCAIRRAPGNETVIQLNVHFVCVREIEISIVGYSTERTAVDQRIKVLQICKNAASITHQTQEEECF